MIRKEIKQDNTFGGNYPYNVNYTVLPTNLIEITEEQRDYIDQNLNILRYDKTQEGIFESPKGVVDISQTTEYIAEQKAKAKQAIVKEYADIFKEFDRICGAKYSIGLCTTNQIIAQRKTLQNELTQKIQEINNG